MTTMPLVAGELFGDTDVLKMPELVEYLSSNCSFVMVANAGGMRSCLISIYLTADTNMF